MSSVVRSENDECIFRQILLFQGTDKVTDVSIQVVYHAGIARMLLSHPRLFFYIPEKQAVHRVNGCMDCIRRVIKKERCAGRFINKLNGLIHDQVCQVFLIRSIEWHITIGRIIALWMPVMASSNTDIKSLISRIFPQVPFSCLAGSVTGIPEYLRDGYHVIRQYGTVFCGNKFAVPASAPFGGTHCIDPMPGCPLPAHQAGPAGRTI